MQSAKIAEQKFWTASSIKDAIERLPKGDAFRGDRRGRPARRLAPRGPPDRPHRPARVGDDVAAAFAGRVNSNLQSGLAFLATVGSTAPFVGLFGTVWGIYHALVAIGVSGQASIDKVAGPVGEALIMTAIGLAVAVPAVMGYNWLIRRNKACRTSLRDFVARPACVPGRRRARCDAGRRRWRLPPGQEVRSDHGLETVVGRRAVLRTALRAPSTSEEVMPTWR